MPKATPTPIELRDREGRRCSLHDVGGRPVVAVFMPLVPAAVARDEMRAELRGLGAALVVVTPAVMCLVSPDDPIRPLEPVAAQHRPALLYKLIGAHPARTTLVVVDDGGEVRWRRETGDLLGSLGRAAAIRLGAGFFPTRREAMVSALIKAPSPSPSCREAPRRAATPTPPRPRRPAAPRPSPSTSA